MFPFCFTAPRVSSSTCQASAPATGPASAAARSSFCLSSFFVFSSPSCRDPCLWDYSSISASDSCCAHTTSTSPVNMSPRLRAGTLKTHAIPGGVPVFLFYISYPSDSVLPCSNERDSRENLILFYILYLLLQYFLPLFFAETFHS